MDTDNAWQIITTLASGVDPITGEIQPADSTLQHPDIVRALYVASMALQERLGNSSTRRAARPERAGAPWSDEEDLQLVQAFEEDIGPNDLADRHQRTRGAIHARLIRLGKIAPDSPDQE
ncbi:hypothetical protein HCU01_24910 [Halomonas cupida]|uniref:Uncharacterized protein n=1 Tax=Halomonas cupida TaxID=44933 RepID=A0A1M7JNC6_9GAMM|nr:hypothetical protein [Halomonas cupida]GEN24542.1 hypothetical protein HCU01_24910 [Halomonas cupida]SHM54508.1 hypothetical protein SAMN05660971_03245 [Halomonas cupida]